MGNTVRLVTLTLALLLPTLAQAYNQAALMNAFTSVVMIRGYNQTGGLAYGSGVVVGKDKVITNCHVLRTTKQPWINRGEDSYPITTVQADAWHDLCLVTSHNLPFTPVPLGKSTDLKRGQEITAIGHSNGTPAPLTSRGEVVGLYDGNPGNVIRSSAKFLMGASGSGLFDMEGNLVGINTFKTAGKGGSIHFALPVEWLTVLEKLPVSTEFPVLGKAIWEEDEDKQPFYMQAAVPESRQDWAKLLKVAQVWTSKVPNSVDAWLTLAHSHEHLNQLAEATKAYAQVTRLDAEHLEGWFKQGLIAQKQGNQQQVRQIGDRFAKVDPDLLAEYAQYVGCASDCKTQ